MSEIKCAQCGSDKIMQNLALSEQSFGSTLMVTLQGNPNAKIFKGLHREPLRATVCGECGNVGLSVENPKGLWRTYTEVN